MIEPDRSLRRGADWRGALVAAAAMLAAPLLAATTPGGIAASAETLAERTAPAGDDPGSRDRRYIIHLAEGLAGRDGPPPALVAVLHGCRQTHRDIMAATRFRAVADANAADADPSNDFVVVFPFVTSYPSVWTEPRVENCWGWWMDQHRLEGRGEVADLDRLLTAVEAEFGTDPARRYAAGLSSGAAMSVALGVSYSERMAAVGSVAGVPFGETANAVAIAWPHHRVWGFWSGVDANCFDAKTYRSTRALADEIRAAQPSPAEARTTPLIAIQSLEDCTVEAPNAENLAEAWRARYDADAAPALEVDCAKDGVACLRRRYDGAEGPVVELVLYDGRASRETHYWVGDNETVAYAEADGPSATCLILNFFDLAPTGDVCD